MTHSVKIIIVWSRPPWGIGGGWFGSRGWEVGDAVGRTLLRSPFIAMIPYNAKWSGGGGTGFYGNAQPPSPLGAVRLESQLGCPPVQLSVFHCRRPTRKTVSDSFGKLSVIHPGNCQRFIQRKLSVSPLETAGVPHRPTCC